MRNVCLVILCLLKQGTFWGRLSHAEGLLYSSMVAYAPANETGLTWREKAGSNRLIFGSRF
jgi:hypothetical protein